MESKGINTTNYIRITHINLNGLRNKLNELISILEYRKSDVLLVSDSRLNEATPDVYIEIPGYKILRKDRSFKKGGGLVVYYRNNLKITLENEFKIKECESLVFKIGISRRKFARVAHIYRPPNSKVQTFLESLESLFTSIDLTSEPFCILGDINIDFLSNNVTKQRYCNLLNSFDLRQVLAAPTRITNTTATLLDHIVLNVAIQNFHTYVLNNSCSDHQGTELYLNIKYDTVPQHHKYITFRCMRQFKQNKFRANLSDINWSVLHEMEDPENQWELIKSTFLNIFDNYAPVKRIRVKNVIRNKPWITNDIKTAIQRRNKLYKEFMQSKCDEKWKQYKVARNKINNMINRSRFHYLQNSFGHQSNNDSKCLWKNVNNFLGRGKNQDSVPSAADLCNHFSYAPVRTLENIPFSNNNFANYLGPSFEQSNDPILCTETDVLRVLQNISSSQAQGDDGISNFMLKQAGPSIVRPLRP